MYLYGFINIHTTHKSRYCHHSTVNPLFRVMSNKPTTFLNKTSQKVPSEAHQASRLTQGAGAADRYGAWSTTKAIRQSGEQTEGTQEAASGIFDWNWLPPTERTISSASCDEGASTWKNGFITLSVRYDRMKCLMDRFFGGRKLADVFKFTCATFQYSNTTSFKHQQFTSKKLPTKLENNQQQTFPGKQSN